MLLFATESNNPLAKEEDSLQTPLLRTLSAAAEKKLNHPLHRNTRLRSWPTEKERHTLFEEIHFQETQSPGTPENIILWKQTQANAFWAQVTEAFDPAEAENILNEYAIAHIAKQISEPLHLEETYTTFKKIGELQWQSSSEDLRRLAEENKLQTATSSSELLEPDGRTRTLPQWQKGLILYQALVQSHKGNAVLSKTEQAQPNLTALKTSARWALGTHLTLPNQPQNLEQTIHTFEQFHQARQNPAFQLQNIPEPVARSIDELITPSPRDLRGSIAPWVPAWKIIPYKHETIRKAAQEHLQNPAYRNSLYEQYKRKLYDRWITSILRRRYFVQHLIRISQLEREKLLHNTLPIADQLINKRIKARVPHISLMAKTEYAWNLDTYQLSGPPRVD